MKTSTLIIISALLLTGCTGKNKNADAFGNFEATEVIVSAETSGRIIKMNVDEGYQINKGSVITLIDTVLLHLQKAELDASIKSTRTRFSSTTAQNEILDQQITNLNVDIRRIENMLKDDAATKKQYDDLTGQVEVLKKQVAANNTQKASINAEISVYEAKKATLNEQISRSTVKSPLKGTVIEKYSEEGELTAAGKPLVKIADLSVIKLKVYVSGGNLGKIKIGDECTVRIDEGEKNYKNFQGKISQISDKAEFTPKILQTKEERVILVYEVTILVGNDGTLKSGMPGEAIFSDSK
ncbi:MAG: HlyD family efflux transporter periplasmic adaptor subunit [Bacteroidales bacterium]|jgi:HlyD family secretion protein